MEREKGRKGEREGTWSGPLHAESNEFGERIEIYGDMFASAKECGWGLVSPPPNLTIPTIFSLSLFIFYFISIF